MNRSTKTILIITILLLLNVSAIYPGDYSGIREWMMKPPSARAAGMGRALVAIVDNANTVFWNPGGITFLEGLNISYNYEPKNNNWTHYCNKIHNISLVKKIKNKFTIGFNFRREYEYRLSGLSDSDIGISFGYNKNSFGIGITTKFLYTKEYGGSRTQKSPIYGYLPIQSKNPSLAVDIGILYSENFDIKNGYMLQFNFGSSLLNISKGIGYTKLTSLAVPYEEGIPRIFRLGYAIKLMKPKGERILKWLTVANNLEYSNVINRDKTKLKWDYKSLGFGFEFAVYEILFFRVGYHYQKGHKNFRPHPYYTGYTYGFGFRLPAKYIHKSLPLSITYDFAQLPWDVKSEFKEYRYFLIHSLNFNYNF